VLFIDSDSLLGLLHRAVAGDVAKVSEVHVSFTFRDDPEDGSDMYLRNISNLTHEHSITAKEQN
jgi:hypothetical protein